MKKKTLKEVITDFHAAHGNHYNYSNVEYVNANTKVKVTCPLHGEFEITPAHHKDGVGCRKCYDRSQRISKKNFVSKAIKHFGYRYDYSLFHVIPKLGDKVPIRCTIHNKVFIQDPRSHMNGHTGCSQCRSNLLTGPQNVRGNFKSNKKLKREFIKRAKNVHGDKYDYSEFEYNGYDVISKIVCPNHGKFHQSPNNHLRGSGCPNCFHDRQKMGTLKEKCKKLKVDYWRALKRRDAGLSEEKIFETGYVRNSRAINEITVYGVTYPNLEEAVRILNPPGNSTTIARWINRGMTPEDAFERIPNPGYANGIIYVVTHKASSKKYVGLTIQTLDRRWKYHIEQASAGCIDNIDSLHAAIRKFGPDSFEVRQIDQGTTKKDLEKKERYWIKKLRTLAPHGYNISRGGVSGGSNKKPTLVDGILFDSVAKAAEYVSKTRNVSLDAAEWRLRRNKVDVKAPAKPGESLVKSKAYKVWSRIVHSVTNPKSKSYIPWVNIYAVLARFQ